MGVASAHNLRVSCSKTYLTNVRVKERLYLQTRERLKLNIMQYYC